MRISSRSRYGLRALSYLTKKRQICSIKEIAEEEGISFDYLEKIFLKLKKADLIKAKRGVEGGYFLAKKPEKITIGEIIRALERRSAPVACLGRGKESCPKAKTCLARNLWQRIKDSWDATLDSVTLAETIKA